MTREHGPAEPLEQRCVEPGHWLIEGRHVRAVFQGRSRKVMSWSVMAFDGEPVPPPFIYLDDARDWIRNQVKP
jgi:hypothetical protein